MIAWKYNNRGLRVFLTLAIIVHVAFILVPLTRKMVTPVIESRSVQVQLLAPPRVSEKLPVPEPLVDKREPLAPILEKLPQAPIARPPPPMHESVLRPPLPNSKRVLSSQFDYQNTAQTPFFGSIEQKEDAPDFYVRQRTSLEMVLNQPSVQLPFEDTRIYLVDSYDDGIMGGIDRFWDTVSVPFGFTTKNNTRVQCVWVLVIAGCGWGHKSLFYRPARHREKPKEPSIENT
jgi:hypothetical protein